jgi:hypothetical protein
MVSCLLLLITMSTKASFSVRCFDYLKMEFSSIRGSELITRPSNTYSKIKVLIKLPPLRACYSLSLGVHLT